MRSRPGEKRRRSDLAGAVGQCQAAAAFLSALRGLYRRLDAVVARRRAVCLGGGACCKFDLAGHRLYLSTGELALLAVHAPPAPGRCERGRCPYQVGPRCVGRDRRPLGCRVFFCAPGLGEWSRRTYEAFHSPIRRLHADHALPYAYVELTSALAALPLRGPDGAGKHPSFFPLTPAGPEASMTEELARTDASGR